MHQHYIQVSTHIKCRTNFGWSLSTLMFFFWRANPRPKLTNLLGTILCLRSNQMSLLVLNYMMISMGLLCHIFISHFLFLNNSQARPFLFIDYFVNFIDLDPVFVAKNAYPHLLSLFKAYRYQTNCLSSWQTLVAVVLGCLWIFFANPSKFDIKSQVSLHFYY